MMYQNTGHHGFRSCCLFIALAFGFSLILYACYNGSKLQKTFVYFKSNRNDSRQHSIRVACMILTRITNWKSKGEAVCNTWAKRCHKAVFFFTDDKNSSHQPVCKYAKTIGLSVPDGRDHLTAKTLAALNYSYGLYGREVDYFFKADDDTYVVYENLLKIIAQFQPAPIYLGRTINSILPNGYNSGGAGYIISNFGAQMLLKDRSQFPKNCQADGGYEDVEIGRCLAKFGIYAQNGTDPAGKLTFHSDNPFRVFQKQEIANAYYINYNGVEFGNKKNIENSFMLSNWTATMHYVTPAEMYMYDFLLYHLERGSNGPHLEKRQ